MIHLIVLIPYRYNRAWIDCCFDKLISAVDTVQYRPANMSAPENTTVEEALQVPEVNEMAAAEAAATSTITEAGPTASSKANPAKNGESSKPQISLQDSLLQRVSTIKEGDNVLLRMPSDMVKAVVASKDG